MEKGFERNYNKYIVMKTDDVKEALSVAQEGSLYEILDIISLHRKKEGKKDNTYVVVDEDEPYSEAVWKLIEDEEYRRSKEWMPK